MCKLIPKSFIDELIGRLDIVEVVSSRIKVKKSGRNFMACCPFHQEKTPSMQVNQDECYFYCHGCGAKGDAVQFIRDFDHIDFNEAVKLLADGIGLEVPKGSYDNAVPKAGEMLKLLGYCQEYYQYCISSHKQRAHAISLLDKLGINEYQASKFGIGFAFGDSNLKPLAGQSKDNKELLVSTGMISNNEVDVFTNCITIPIRNKKGVVIAFEGLGFNGKLINSIDTPLFSRRKEVYGLSELLSDANKIDTIFVSKGMKKTIIGHGFVSTLGVTPTKYQLNAMFKHAEHVVINFDSNAEVIKSFSSMFSVIDDNKHIAIDLDRENPIPLTKYFFDYLGRAFDLSTIEDKMDYEKEANKYIMLMKDSYLKQLIKQEVQINIS